MERAIKQHAQDEPAEFKVLCRVVGVALEWLPRQGRPARPLALQNSRATPGLSNGGPPVSAAVLIQMAMHHRCLPLLAEGLARVRQEGQLSWVTFEPEMQARMNRALAVGAGRAVFLARRLVSLAGTFKDAGVRAMALKGPAMAQALYGHVDYRPSDDLDLWIHPGDFAKASGIMESLGFTPLVCLSADEARAHMKAGWDRGYRSPAGDYVVELCTGMAPSYFARPPEADVFWAGAEELTLEGGQVRTPGPEALLELLCLHGTKHGWSRLLWVADVAALGGAKEGIDWVALSHLTKRHGTERMTALGFSLARVCLGADIPWKPAPVALVQRASRFLSGRERCAGFRQEMGFHLAARERWRDRARYVVLALFMPGFGDWRWVRLPRSLFGLYWILRPFRLLRGGGNKI